MTNKTEEVVDGAMLFINALIRDHWADERDVYVRLAALCEAKAARLVAIDPNRNR